MPRPQFTVRALLVIMLVVGAFLGGMILQRTLHGAVSIERAFTRGDRGMETMRMGDGTVWHRWIEVPPPPISELPE